MLIRNLLWSCIFLTGSSFIFDVKPSWQYQPGRPSRNDTLKPALYDTGYGLRLNGSDDVWWCGPVHKIGQKRPVPPVDQKSDFVSVRLARNEYEAVQVVICPSEDIKNVTVSCSDLDGPYQTKINASFVTIDQVVYVPVKIPTDSIGAADSWPDPLPPVVEPVTLKARTNQPFWITVYAPKALPGGLYKGLLPQSWRAGGPPGRKWGNGDGRFFYPPNRDPNNNKEPFISGPVNSLRWELLRDGIEDYEYFWMLQQQVNAREKMGDLNDRQEVWLATAKNLLKVPDNITSSLVSFAKDPTHLMAHREKLAEAIIAGKKLFGN